jgi:hypothetical protein
MMFLSRPLILVLPRGFFIKATGSPWIIPAAHSGSTGQEETVEPKPNHDVSGEQKRGPRRDSAEPLQCVLTLVALHHQASKFDRPCKSLTSKHKQQTEKANHEEHQDDCQGVLFILCLRCGLVAVAWLVGVTKVDIVTLPSCFVCKLGRNDECPV